VAIVIIMDHVLQTIRILVVLGSIIAEKCSMIFGGGNTHMHIVINVLMLVQAVAFPILTSIINQSVILNGGMEAIQILLVRHVCRTQSRLKTAIVSAHRSTTTMAVVILILPVDNVLLSVLTVMVI